MKLRNGSEEVDSLVVTTMLVLEDLWSTHPLHVYELAEVCRDPKHKPFGQTGADLEQLGLLSGGAVHGSVRNIVLSAIRGEGLSMSLGSPVA